MTDRRLDLLSVVAPVLDEASILEVFHKRLADALDGLDWELVLVDDGSTDDTAEVIDRIANADIRVRGVILSRNFGYQAAMSAGIDHAVGDAVVTIDADLQDPPEVIPELIERWREGADVVFATRQSRDGEGWLKLRTARWFTSLFIRLGGLQIPADAGDFRLLDRCAVTALRAMPERSRFLRGMTAWVGYRQATVAYRRDARYAGDTRYRWRTLIRMSLDALSSFSHIPLQLATLLGFVVSFVAFMGIPYTIATRLLGFYVEGLSTLLFAVLALGGIQLITLGIIGEYISRIYDEVKRRPLYIVRARKNVDAPAGTEVT